MDHMNLLSNLSIKTDSKIVMLVIDGIGGIPDEKTGKTELETANTPNLDALVEKSVCGFTVPVKPGITPGSGPGHLGIFGYDPVKYEIGRGALAAAGVGFEQTKDDLAARINFCTVDDNGKVTDRRAGRIASEIGVKLCEKLSKITIKGIKLFVLPVKEHRAVVIFRTRGHISDHLTGSDPQKVGVPPLKVQATDELAERTAEFVNQFIEEAGKVLAEEHPANMLLLRGFSVHPDMPTFQKLYKLDPAAIATYPMYKGVAQLVGMEVLKVGETISEEFDALAKNFNDYSFFYVHIKKTDSRGEDGNFEEKVKVIEKLDHYIPQLTELNPDVIVVTGDHSTPAVMKGHSWHPVPTFIHSKYCRPDLCKTYSESEFTKGGLGQIEAEYLMGLAMGNALKLEKFGA